MEPDAFERFVRSMGIGSRRQVIGSAAAGVLAAMVGGEGRLEAAGVCKPTGRTCRHGAQCCSGKCSKKRRRCRPTTNPDPTCAGGPFCCPPEAGCQSCGADSQGCICATTAEGGGICLATYDCGDPCATSADCGKNAVCVQAKACCGDTNTCVPYTARCAFAPSTTGGADRSRSGS